MTACATTATSVSFPDKSDGEIGTLRSTLLCGGWLASLATGIFSFMTASYARRSGFVDLPCRNTYALPLRLIQITTLLYLFLVVSIGIVVTAVWTSRRLLEILERPEVKTPVGLVFAYGEGLVMWLTLALIIFIRQRAKQIFGPSYQVQSSTSFSRTTLGLISYLG